MNMYGRVEEEEEERAYVQSNICLCNSTRPCTKAGDYSTSWWLLNINYVPTCTCIADIETQLQVTTSFFELTGILLNSL